MVVESYEREESIAAVASEYEMTIKSMELIFAEDAWQESLVLLDCNDKLWEAICLFEGFPFRTSKGLKFSYKVKGNEIFVDRKEKSKSAVGALSLNLRHGGSLWFWQMKMNI